MAEGFLLSRHWRDRKDGIELEFWLSTDSGPKQLVVPGQSAVFFLPAQWRQQAQAELVSFHYRCEASEHLRDFALQPVDTYYFQSQRALREARDHLMARNLSPFEADIAPHDRFLMERFIRGGIRYSASSASEASPLINPKMTGADYWPSLKVVSLDIETAMTGVQLYSIAVYARHSGQTLNKIFMVSADAVADDVEVFSDERSLFLRFLQWLEDYDPDLIIGWNVVNFDCWFLEQVARKHRIAFTLGRSSDAVSWRELDQDSQRKQIIVKGRVVLDGIEVLKAATYQFESFALAAVAEKVLGDSKLIKGDDRGEKITELFWSDKNALAQYNLHDCKLVWDIFEQLGLIEFAIERSRLTGLPLDRIGGSVAAFDFRYLPLLHRRHFVAPNGHQRSEIEHSPGGLVLESRPGIYDHVLVLDFKSLYPSIIRSFQIDPLALATGTRQDLDQSRLVPGFNGAWFSRDDNLLPALIDELWQARDQAKARQNKALSQSIKIIMNSFYGVLGSAGCRFFDPRLASSITRRGHQIIRQTAEFIERSGWQTIYGDTDSVFVWLQGVKSDEQARSEGQRLASQLNRWWRDRLADEYGLQSALEIEFETHFQRFLMPTVRGSEQGSKKRYAGLISEAGAPKLIFKGLETVRTDWTRLARDFQAQLYRCIFFDQPYRDFVVATTSQVLSGQLDDQLVYRKRLRRKLHDYQRNIPPHVQAALKLEQWTGQRAARGDWVEYLITVNGAEPLAARRSAIDYQHYIDRQLAPVADGILLLIGDSFAGITARQITLF